MRAAAPSAPASAAGPLSGAEATLGGSQAGAAAADTSSTSASGDRGADPSQQGQQGRPFAAALASAQADCDRKPGSLAGPVSASIEEAAGEPQPLRLTSAAKAGGKSPAAAPAPGAPTATVAATPIPIVMPSAAADAPDAAGGVAAKADQGTAAAPAGSASVGKARSGKRSETAARPDQSALPAVAALLGAAAQASSVPAAASAPTSSAHRSSENGTDSAAAAAPGRVGANDTVPNDSPAQALVSVPSALRLGSTGASTSAGYTGGSFAASSAADRAGGASPGSASPATGLGPLMQNLAAAARATSATPAASIGVPVSHPDWPNALAAQVQWMATRQVQSATLRLSPEHLGPLEVRIDVTGSQINVNFTAHHADTREALAQAVPQLRQLFASGGLNLGEATVRQEARSSEQPPLPPQPGITGASETVEPVANTATQRLGLVDEYA